MSGPRLRTVVADTSALVSLAVPRADAAIGTDVPDPFQYLLTSCDVVVPPEVVAELRDITQYQDIHAAAASNVLAARGHYTVEDPYARDDTPDARPTFGLDDGETDGIVLSNALDVDGFHRRVWWNELPAHPRRATGPADRPDTAAHLRLRPERPYDPRGGANATERDQPPPELGQQPIRRPVGSTSEE